MLAGCPPAGPGPQDPIGVSHPPAGDAGVPDVAEESDAEAPVEVVVPPVEFGPCMSPDAVLAWAGERGATVVAEALARHLTDRTPSDRPAVPADRVGGWIRELHAAPLNDPDCASLVVTLWFDPDVYLTAAAGEGAAQGIAIFSPALTEPAVSFVVGLDGREACRVLRIDDLDGDERDELLVERLGSGSGARPVQEMYVFRDESDPLPVWVSDDDAVRRALFGTEGEADPTNRMEPGDVRFYVEDGAPRIRADYRLFVCSREESGGETAETCEPTGAQTLVFTRLGDVYLLPGEPEPGAPWGRPDDDDDVEG